MKLSNYINRRLDLANAIVEAQNAFDDNPVSQNAEKLAEAQSNFNAWVKENHATHQDYLKRLTR